MSEKEHEYAELLRWIADGECVQWQDDPGKWHVISYNELLGHIRESAFPPGRYRITPRTITINGFSVPAPMRVAPQHQMAFWLVDIYGPALSSEERWNDQVSRYPRYLAAGLCHATHQAAEAHARALLSFTETKP